MNAINYKTKPYVINNDTINKDIPNSINNCYKKKKQKKTKKHHTTNKSPIGPIHILIYTQQLPLKI